MDAIRGTIVTHLPDGHVGPTNVDALRKADPTPVPRFTALVRAVAQVATHHHHHFTFYRGQAEDWRNKGHKTTIYPTLYRPVRGQSVLRSEDLAARAAILLDAVNRLRANHKVLGRGNELWRYREYATALLQHYELCPTPMIDITTSLHVAASFARGESGEEAGVVYVVAMPYPTETLSLYPRFGMVLARLLSLCPPDARRPQFQEGWLVGRMPLTPEKTPRDDLADRVIAKYAIPAGTAFWDGQFRPIPRAALIPKDDPFADRLLDVLGDWSFPEALRP